MTGKHVSGKYLVQLIAFVCRHSPTHMLWKEEKGTPMPGKRESDRYWQNTTKYCIRYCGICRLRGRTLNWESENK